MKATRRLAFVSLAALLPACGGGGGGGGGAPSGPGPLLVVQRVPDTGGTPLPLSSSLYVRLNRAANPATLAGNVVLRRNGVPLPTVVTFDPCSLLITIDPTGSLADSGADYTVTITSGLQDVNGVAAAGETYTITTAGGGDGTPPDFSGSSFTVTGATTNSLTLDWDAATDGTGPIQYLIWIIPPSGCFDPTVGPVKTTTTLTADTLSGLQSDTRHHLRIRARDGAGNLSDQAYDLLAAKTLTDFSQDVWTEIISARCLGCHIPGGIAPFSMESVAIAHGNLVNVAPVCSGGLPDRVEPFDSANSFMFRKVSMDNPGCGARMPFDGATTGYLTQQQQDTIRDWIDEGALNN